MKTSVLILIFSGLVSLKQCSINDDIIKLTTLEKNNVIDVKEKKTNLPNSEKKMKNLLLTPFFYNISDGKNTSIPIINYN